MMVVGLNSEATMVMVVVVVVVMVFCNHA